MQIGLGIGIPFSKSQVWLAVQTIFTPASLFTTGVNGVWHDPSDLTTLFQDAAGTTPVTAVEQPVGRMLDKSGRGNHFFQSISANRPTLSAKYNLLTGTEPLGTQTVTTQATSYRLTFSGAGTIALSGSSVLAAVPAGTYTFSAAAGSLVVTVAGSVTQADIRATNDALGQPAYQRVNTSTDYDTAGFKPYLRFNGTSSSMQTNSIDFTATDKMFVCAGVRKLSDAAVGIIAELSNDFAVNPGSFVCSAADNAKAYIYLNRGNAAPSYAQSGFISGAPAPDTAVLVSTGNISGDLSTMRRNGVAGTNGTADQGAGNYGNYPLYIGARAGTSLWFNGRLHQLVVAGKQASASEITNTETFINQKTGAY